MCRCTFQWAFWTTIWAYIFIIIWIHTNASIFWFVNTRGSHVAWWPHFWHSHSIAVPQPYFFRISSPRNKNKIWRVSHRLYIYTRKTWVLLYQFEETKVMKLSVQLTGTNWAFCWLCLSHTSFSIRRGAGIDAIIEALGLWTVSKKVT